MSSAPEVSIERAYFRIGDLTVCVDAPPYPVSERLNAYRCEPVPAPDRRLTVRAVPQVTAPEQILLRKTGITEFHDPQGGRTLFCQREDGAGLLYKAAEQGDAVTVDYAADCLNGLSSHLILRWLELPRTLLKRDELFLHASYIAFEGKAILFTAPKQTGKSTQARLWEQYRGAEPINGDRALLREEDGLWYACGSPFCGSSNLCKNRTLPLAAIVILRQGAKNAVAQANERQALLSFLEGVTYDVNDRSAMDKVMTLAQRIKECVPFYALTCLPDEGAVACLHNRLIEEGIYG